MNDEELEALLGRDEALADDGFTARVVTALPAPRKRAPRGVILLGTATLASALSFVLAPDALGALVHGVRHATSITPVLALGAILAVLVGAALQEARATS